MANPTPLPTPPTPTPLSDLRTEVTSIRLSLTQVVAIVVAIFSMYFFVEDRYAKQAPVSADLDALKKTVISFVSSQTKFNREVTENFRNQQLQISELSRQVHTEYPRDSQKEKPLAVSPVRDSMSSSASSTFIPDIKLPERLFTDSRGDPVVELFPEATTNGLDFRQN